MAKKIMSEKREKSLEQLTPIKLARMSVSITIAIFPAMANGIIDTIKFSLIILF